MEEVKYLYRYDTNYMGDLKCYKFDIIKETPSGYWIKDHEETLEVDLLDISNYRLPFSKKWFSKHASRPWAYDNENAALRAFIYRKKYQIKCIKNKLNVVEDALTEAEILLKTV